MICMDSFRHLNFGLSIGQLCYLVLIYSLDRRIPVVLQSNLILNLEQERNSCIEACKTTRFSEYKMIEIQIRGEDYGHFATMKLR